MFGSMKERKASGPDSTAETGLEAWAVKGTPPPTAEYDFRSSIQESVSGFRWPILSELIMWFPFIGHGSRHVLLGSRLLQLCFLSVLKFLSKWLIHFFSHVCIIYVLLCTMMK